MDEGSPLGFGLLFLLCLAGSFYFSATEMAFSTVSRVRMRSYAEDGDKRAGRVLYILDRFDQALTAILIGNNIVNISCATIATVFATRVWGSASVSVAMLVVTVIVFLLGETLPKTFAKALSETFAMRVSGSLLLIMRALRPLVFLFGRLTDAVSRPFRDRQKAPTVTELELRDIIDDAVQDGALDEETGALVRSAIRYSDATVHDIITPWKQVRKLPVDTPHEETIAILQRSSHSRLPVIDGTGEVIGLMRVRRYLKATLAGGDAPPTVRALMEGVHSVGTDMPVDDLLPMMSGHKTHFMLVRDEWENVQGIVTVEDILERLVGDIWDEDDVQGGVADAR